ncbi:MAG: ribose 5-phosphate isomerase B [Acidimicrobiia bacterium]|nr:MAG: ribose 5-phosphate isomerase B [Acidimicrobiia bacterium]
MTARDPNIEQDVRAMVRNIVDGLFESASAEDRTRNPGHRRSEHAPTVAVGGDHGGFAMKERIAFKLSEQGFEVIDCGTNSAEVVDYPDIAAGVARKVASGEADAGIIVDGAGIGSAMVANKIPGVRAALCHDISTARNAREHNHANVLTLGAGLIGDVLAWQITQEFFATPYGEGRHARRVGMIDALDGTVMENAR